MSPGEFLDLTVKSSVDIAEATRATVPETVASSVAIPVPKEEWSLSSDRLKATDIAAGAHHSAAVTGNKTHSLLVVTNMPLTCRAVT